MQFIDTYETVNPISARELSTVDLPEREKEKLKKKLMALGYIGSENSNTIDSTRLTNINNLGLVYYERKEYQKAEVEFLKALDLRPDYIDALHNLALIYLAQGKKDLALENAAKMLTSSMAIGEQDYTLVIKLGEKIGYLTKLEEILYNQIEQNPAKLEPIIALGMLYQHLQRGAKAELAYKKALMINPNAQIPLMQMFNYLTSQNRMEEAEQLLSKAIEQDVNNAFLHSKLGTIYLQQTNFIDALREFEKALELEPDKFEALFYMGLCYGSQGKLREAVKVFEKVLEYYPENYDALLNLGATFAKLGKLDRALSVFRKAYAIGPKTPMLLNSLGMVYLQMGKIESAVSSFEQSLQLFPDQQDAKVVEDYLRQIRDKEK